MALLGRFTLIWLPSLLTLKVPETAWLLALTGRVNKTLVFFTHLFCSKNELSVRSRTVGPQPPRRGDRWAKKSPWLKGEDGVLRYELIHHQYWRLISAFKILPCLCCLCKQNRGLIFFYRLWQLTSDDNNCVIWCLFFHSQESEPGCAFLLLGVIRRKRRNFR